jgi:hypothetical protein
MAWAVRRLIHRGLAENLRQPGVGQALGHDIGLVNGQDNPLPSSPDALSGDIGRQGRKPFSWSLAE